MRIALVNWAKVWDGASVGGGVNGYAQALALELRDLGHEVDWICGGTTYVKDKPLHVRRHPDWFGIRVFEFINSPVLAPSIVQFQDPASETASPDLEARFHELLGWLAPDVVHFHNVEGLSAGCVAPAARAGPRPAFVFSLHNYHTICPQVYLLQGHRRLCHDFLGGEACATCIPAPSPGETRREREAEWEPPKRTTPTLDALRTEVGKAIGGLVRTPPAPKDPPGIALTGPASVAASMPLDPASDSRGRTARVLADRSPLPRPEVHLPILNDALPDPSTTSPRNAYGTRRLAMIDALNRCDAVLAVSRFVHDKFRAMGVESSRLRAMPIGTVLNRVVDRRRSLAFPPPPFDPASPRPIRLVFMGVNHWYKGLPFLLETMESLEPEVLGRFHLSIYAQGAEQTEWMARRLEPRLAGLVINRGYDQADIPWILGGKDLGIVPSVWWDNAPQTVFELFACSVPVLGAAVGGIPDFVTHGHNGLLFRGNDAADLAARLREVAANPAMLAALRANVRPPRDIRDHAVELLTLYDEVVAGRSSRAGLSAAAGQTPEAHGAQR